jgi:hypothetical protein
MKFDIPRLRYCDGYKYQTYERYEIPTPFSGKDRFIAARDGGQHWVDLQRSGLLVIREGYAWDGASGPTIDTKSSFVPSLVHDALFQLSRASLLLDLPQAPVDDFFEALCVKCGMWRWRAKLWRGGLRVGAAYAYKPQPERVLVAP